VKKQPSTSAEPVKEANTTEVNSDFLAALKNLYEDRKELTAIPVTQYQSLFSELMRDEVQIILPRDQNDMFSEELRIII